MDIAIGAVQGVERPEPLLPRELEARKASKQFEAVMLSQSFETMFEGVDAPSLVGGGHAEKVWQSVLIDEMAKGVVEGGGVGIADKIYKEMMSE